MKLIITEEFSAVLRNENSATMGQFWYDKVDVELVGKKRKVSFFVGDKFTGYITVDEVEHRGIVSKGREAV